MDIEYFSIMEGVYLQLLVRKYCGNEIAVPYGFMENP